MAPLVRTSDDVFTEVPNVFKPAILCMAALLMTAPAFAQSHSVAPADEYFGRLKMSVLGIANVIKDMRLRVEADASRTPSIFGSLANVEDALRDWESKYPHDSWIPRNLLALEICYLTAPGERARQLAIRTEAWLRRDFGRTAYAAQGRHKLDEALVAQQPQDEPEGAR
jgi:hypothetical protein